MRVFISAKHLSQLRNRRDLNGILIGFVVHSLNLQLVHIDEMPVLNNPIDEENSKGYLYGFPLCHSVVREMAFMIRRQNSLWIDVYCMDIQQRGGVEASG